MANDEEDTTYWDWMVLINDEGEHSLWPAVNGIPAGWRAVGPTGPKSVCLAYVEEHWTDMRPRSLRS
jgi:uncharacterized protein YbdZ (MbtH family)